MMFLRPITRSISTSTSVKKAVHNIQVQQGAHLKEKIVTAEKGLALLAIGTFSVFLPAPVTVNGVANVETFWQDEEEPFDSH